MKKENKDLEFNFTEAAVYKIVFQGEMESDQINRLFELQVSVQKRENKKPITTLIGKINDQSQLSGILTMLNDMHMTVISVNMLSDVEN